MSNFLKGIRPVRGKKKFKEIFQYQKGKIIQKYFFLYHAQSPDHAYLGIQIGKQYLKKAVKRNSVKRMIREYIRLNQKKIPTKYIVIGVRRNIDNMEKTEIKKCFYQLIEKFTQRVKKY
jgi:ribonuclease P protein component